jgi:poly(3-hydroxybutyrate) depolymerase
MKIATNALALVFILPFYACSSNPDKQNKPAQEEIAAKADVKENFPTGQVIDKVNCTSDTTLSYTLYLPKGYDMKKEFPIIYAFDPHAAGKIPVSNYKDLAEKFGYIIIGSNNTQNGMAWEQTEAIVAAVFTDTKNRLLINESRIYAMGFSGGARTANALTISINRIAGVICCGAANPAHITAEPRNNYTFFGIAGNTDFNYTELRKYDILDLAANRIKHAIVTFDGKHEWPPANTMEDAFLWLELNSMRKSTSAKNETMITANMLTAKEMLSEYLKQHKEYDAYELCRRTLNYYENLADLSVFFDAYKKLKTNAAVDKQLKENEASWSSEEKLKQEYINALGTKSYDWWQKDIAALNQKIRTGKDKEEILILKRILGFLSLACYMQTSSALKQNNIPAAEYAGRLYILVDPKNTEAAYLMADIQAKQGKQNDAIKSLQLAVKNGFADKERMENDSAFFQIKSTAEFQKLLEKAK